MEIKDNPIKTNLVFIIFILLIVAPACERFLPFPENEELKFETLLLNSPINGCTISLDTYNQTKFEWTDIDLNKNYHVDYELYLSENPNPGLYESGLTDNYYYINLAKNKTYYWKVVAKLDAKFVESEVWGFTTK